MPKTRPAARRLAMRNFFNSHWKVIVAILLAIVLATLTVETKSAHVPLVTRLQEHAQALAPDAPCSALRHVETSLQRYGYTLHKTGLSSATLPGHTIEAAVASVAPGATPSRTFLVGARVGPGGDVGASAVLELARAVKDLRLESGTEIRFVFFMDAAPHANNGVGNFIAFIGTPAASQRVHQAFAALRSDPHQIRHGLATSAHVMGLTLTSHGLGSAGTTTLLITGPDFLGYPYFHTAPLPGEKNNEAPDEYDGLARVVDGLARTLKAMAGVVQA